MNIDSLKKCVNAKSVPHLGLYIHIPFCRVRCQFCAFYVQIPQEKRVQAFLAGLAQEIELYGRDMGLGNISVSSVYFGGGTPTVLSAKQLVAVVDDIQRWFAVSDDAEISIEAHPGTMNREDLHILHSRGFNRISIGAQSFDDEELLQLGGRVVSQATETAVALSRQAGFENISLDLMYGFPGHSTSSWQRTLDATLALEPRHLSCYAFTVEEGSHFYDKVVQGIILAPNEEVQASLALFTADYLNAAGFEQYEISNFCQPGFSCQHNLRYWQGESYLGLGPSAQSFVSGVRFGNPSDLDFYCVTIAQGDLPVEQMEVLDSQEVQREHIVFGLRTMKGVLLSQVKSLSEINGEWGRAVHQLHLQGLLREEEGYVRLTQKGLQYADTVAVALL